MDKYNIRVKNGLFVITIWPSDGELNLADVARLYSNALYHISRERARPLTAADEDEILSAKTRAKFYQDVITDALAIGGLATRV